MTPVDLALTGLALFLAAALLATVTSPRVTATLSALAGLTLLAAAAAVLAGADGSSLALSWLPGGPDAALRLDPLSAFFLAPIGLIGALGPIYGAGYYPRAEHPASDRPVRAGYATLTASLALVALANDGAVFLLAWETMALSGFLLILADHRRADVRAAAFVYLVATHLSTLALWWFFTRVEAATGTFGFALLPAGDPATTGTMLLALLGFGIKAGFVPLHVWLPGAHAAAPTHVSAILSGVVLKVGVYGLLRATTLAPDLPVGFGGLILALGALAAVLGVALALAQHDLKRLLAYHSIENIGIILLGVGLALLGRATDHPSWTALGLAGALLHVWNHALFKSLLFFGAGAAIRAAGTRAIDRLGGLAKRQPVTAFAFLIGAVAISGLPPLNGFVSELLIYLGLFDAARHGAPAVALAAPALAIVGALALACFVKVYGAVFLGTARTPAAAAAPPAPTAMRAPMLVLVALCTVIGLAPWLVAPALDRVIADLSPAAAAAVPAIAERAAFVPLSAIAVALVAIAAAVFFARRRAHARAPRTGTWGCGYAAPTPRIQYTASSFAATLTRLFRGVLRPEVHPPRLDGPLPGPSHYAEHPRDAVLDGAAIPLFTRAGRVLTRVRQLQSGRVQLYLLLLLVAVIVLLASTLPIGEYMEGLWNN